MSLPHSKLDPRTPRAWGASTQTPEGSTITTVTTTTLQIKTNEVLSFPKEGDEQILHTPDVENQKAAAVDSREWSQSKWTEPSHRFSRRCRTITRVSLVIWIKGCCFLILVYGLQFDRSSWKSDTGSDVIRDFRQALSTNWTVSARWIFSGVLATAQDTLLNEPLSILLGALLYQSVVQNVMKRV